MTVFSAGVLFGAPRTLDTAVRWAADSEILAATGVERTVWAAADFLNGLSARHESPPKPPTWGDDLRRWGQCDSRLQPLLAALIEVADEVGAGVYAEVYRRWCARRSVLETWAARLYAPPAGPPYQPAVYDAATMWAELNAVSESSYCAAQAWNDFDEAMSRSYYAALRDALDYHSAAVTKACADMQSAATSALAALNAG
ncbi:hypothetical protein [Mycolicibacterium sp. 120270]|uniref:hypothetical protein n=1 Tax=Mycolicibacterium sp. 120270 TaxID=3090600 RepID=UPI00299E7925|nr:hypothetical protein [Mycolicibacterium sp. 120270]MDX1887901.1 hypothetical protein [Mycolicibacterium sp. 120270]